MNQVIDTLGPLLTLKVTPTQVQDRAVVSELAADVQAVTGETVERAFGDQGYTGEPPPPPRGSPSRW